ncbi:MAG: hypothetical protein FJW34_19910 [Acidobacteria bacterium]|nr:hypothetical protein [Acidobacteriota bacterium]
MVEKAQKDREAKEAAKRQALEAQEAAKQQEVRAKYEAEQRERRKRLYNEAPMAFFGKYIENKLSFTTFG